MTAWSRTRDAVFACFVTLTALFAAGAFVVAAQWLGRAGVVGPTPWLSLIMSIGLLLAEIRPPSWLTFGDVPISVSWVFAFSLVLMGAPTGALGAIAFSGALSAIVSRSRPVKLIFNVAQLVVSLACGIAVLRALGADTELLPGRSPGGIWWMLGVIVSAGVVYGVNAVLVAVGVALRHRRSFTSTLVDGLRANVAGDGVLLALAPVVVVVGQRGLILLPFTALTAVGVFGLARVALRRQHAATHDPLTGLVNRRGFEEQCAVLVERRRRELLAVILIDLDRFKPINDNHGHAVGDAVLSELAERIGARAPAAAVTARLGGDEFVVAWLSSSHEAAERIGSEIGASIAAPIEVGELVFDVTGSLGLSLGAEDTSTALAEADAAMYQAKVGAHGMVTFDPSHVGDRPPVATTHDLVVALGFNQLEVCFRPSIWLANGRFAGVEAVVGQLDTLAGDWHPVAAPDDDEAATALGWFALECTVALLEDPSGSVPRASVPLSAHLLVDPLLVERLARLLRQARVEPGRLLVGVDGHDVATRVELSDVAEELAGLGVGLVVENVGPELSFSSFTLPGTRGIALRSEVARSLVGGPVAPATVGAIIDAASRLGLDVLATVDDFEMLRAAQVAGCTLAAGTSIADPLSPPVLERWASLMTSPDQALSDVGRPA